MKKKTFFYTALAILSWVYSSMFNSADYDLWARMSVGKIFFQLGHVLKHDIFSFTPTKNLWIDHEWGSGVIFYVINNYFGTVGLFALKAAGIFLILYLISKIVEIRSEEKNSHMKLGVYYLAYLGMSYGVMAIIRCQLFTFILFTLWIYILERVRKGENRLLWIFPATMMIWANLHGGFVAGLGLLLIYGVGEFLNSKPFSKYFLIAIPSSLIILLNPYGLSYIAYMFQATTMNRFTIQEWQPVTLFDGFASWTGFKIFLIFSIIALISSFIRTKFRYKNIDKVKYLLVFATMYLSIRYIKHMPLFAIAGSAFLYQDFYAIFSAIKNFLIKKIGSIAGKILDFIANVKEIILYGLIIVCGIILIANHPYKPMIDPLKYPVGSIDFIKQNKLTGNILTLMHWGSFAIWELYPNCYLAEDGRYEEVYSENLHLDVYKFNYMYDRKKRSFINDFHTDIIIVEKVNSTYPEMLANKKWTPVFTDLISTVFVPTNKVKKNYIRRTLGWDMIYKDKFVTSMNFLNK